MSDPTTLDPRLLEQLPTLPGTAVEYLRLCGDPSVGVRDVADVAQRDPALLARILQVANSPFYAPREPVTDVSRAAAILGLRSLKMIGVGFAILGDLWTSTVNSQALSGIIGASTMAGSGARSFSVRVGTGRDEEAFTSSLLSFVGELALLRCYPQDFAELWDDSGKLPSLAMQHEAFGADGVVVGTALMERWGIPDGLREAVRARKQPVEQRMQRTSRVYDAALGFGTSIAEMMTGEDEVIERLSPSARAWGFSDREMMDYWSEFRTSVRHTNQQLGLDVGKQLDAMIVDAKEEYMSSAVRASGVLDAAQREIAALKAENARLMGLSLEDPLTGVPNRPAFVNHLRASLASRSRDDAERLVGVAMFDLDNFKVINDSHGHLVGDRLLKAVAAAAQHTVRKNELFARLGGDEFAMVFRPSSLAELEMATERVRVAMVEGNLRDGGVSGVTVSAGAAIIERVDENIEAAENAVTRAADDALYAAKREGRDRSFVTSPMSIDHVGGSLGP